jgi:hypothetical protein
VETAACWTDVEVVDGVTIANGDTTMYAEVGGDQHAERPTCSGPTTMADGAQIVVKDGR